MHLLNVVEPNLNFTNSLQKPITIRKIDFTFFGSRSNWVTSAKIKERITGIETKAN